ncbi:MAG: hypothetical protein P8183_04555 [Anaerolineae bacterium]|jgi:hypothetical protein
MSRKTLYTLVGAIHLVFGFGFLLLPGVMVALYGAPLDESGTLMTQLLGASDLASAALLLALRDIDASKAARTISIKGALEWSLITLIVLLYSITGLLNFLGWISVVLFAVIVYFFARDVFQQQDAAAA